MVDEKRFEAVACRTAVFQVDVTGKTRIVVRVGPDDISSFVSPASLDEADSKDFGFSQGSGLYDAAPLRPSPVDHAYYL